MNKMMLFAVAIIVLSCSSKTQEPKFYGSQFDTTKAISIGELQSQMTQGRRVEAVITGSISSSCKSEGCWMNLQNSEGKEVYVDWDHQFNIPLEAEGKTAYVNGYAYYDSTDHGTQLAFKATGAWL